MRSEETGCRDGAILEIPRDAEAAVGVSARVEVVVDVYVVRRKKEVRWDIFGDRLVAFSGGEMPRGVRGSELWSMLAAVTKDDSHGGGYQLPCRGRRRNLTKKGC